MDKNTLSNYGWIVIAVLVLSVMIALATPFGNYVEMGVRSTVTGLFDTSNKAMEVVGMSAGDGNFEDGYKTPGDETETPNIPDTPTTPQIPEQLTTVAETDMSGITNGRNVWTDGTNIYYSEGTYHRVLVNGKWEAITWEGYTNFYGSYIWMHDGIVYLSAGSYTDYKLEGKTWVKVNFSQNVSYKFIWSDGTNTYYSNGSRAYRFNGSDFVENGAIQGYGDGVWTDGTNIYLSSGSVHTILQNGKFVLTDWTSPYFEGAYIWTDGTYTYVSFYDYSTSGHLHYVLIDGEWVEKEWTGFKKFAGNDIWTDGTNVYYTATSKTYLIS